MALLVTQIAAEEAAFGLEKKMSDGWDDDGVHLASRLPGYMQNQGCQMVYLYIYPKMSILVYFGRPCDGKLWYISRPCGILWPFC
jgi:hypothetical protein